MRKAHKTYGRDDSAVDVPICITCPSCHAKLSLHKTGQSRANSYIVTPSTDAAQDLLAPEIVESHQDTVRTADAQLHIPGPSVLRFSAIMALLIVGPVVFGFLPFAWTRSSSLLVLAACLIIGMTYWLHAMYRLFIIRR